MELQEQGARARQARRGGKRKEKAVHGGGKRNTVTPVAFKLHTALLAERRKQHREEKEVAQMRHAQQKILGKKTVEDFAQLKLIRRETAATRSRNLHCNGKLHSSLSGSEKRELCNSSPELERTVHVESRPLLSARTPYPTQEPDILRQRPQSAKPVLQTQPHSAVADGAGNADNKDFHLPSPIKKKKKKKAVVRDVRRLSASESTPSLSRSATCSQSLPTCKKIKIIVNMRRLQLEEEEGSPLSNISPPLVTAREAWTIESSPLSSRSKDPPSNSKLSP